MTTLPAHGVLIQLDELGVYLIGDSGVGKSEAALQLIQQGATLICDDAPEIASSTGSGKLLGVCPDGFYGLMHIRDLGIIDIRQLLGKQSFKKSQRIDFIVELIKTHHNSFAESQTSAQYRQWQYLDDKHNSWIIPGMRIHLHPHRNSVLLIKTAVKQFILSRHYYE